MSTRPSRGSFAALLASLAFLAIGGVACSPGSSDPEDAAVDLSGPHDLGTPNLDAAAGDANAVADSGAADNGTTEDSGTTDECDDPGLDWNTANKTNYTSYPEPGSQECVEFNGCMWEGLFAGCEDKQTEAWVAAHNIAAVFPGFNSLEHHRLCLRSGTRRMIVHVLDTCADSDCDGCCTDNRGSADALIDLESYTNARWGLEDGPIEWADLGEAPSPCP